MAERQRSATSAGVPDAEDGALGYGEETVSALVRQGWLEAVAAGGTGADEAADMEAQLKRIAGTGDEAGRAHFVRSSAASTRAVHSGERVKGGKKARATLDALATPIVQSSTFTFRTTRECIDYNQGAYASFEYGRYGNPTTRAVEEKLIDLETGGRAALATATDALVSASGMNAVTTMLLALFTAAEMTSAVAADEGGCIITTTDCYRRTRQFMEEMLPRLRVRVEVIDPSDVPRLEELVRGIRASRNPRIARQRVVFFSESPTNPLLRLVDLPRVVSVCQAHEVLVCVDSTFATPIHHRPLELGADLVLHSGTKYLAGHNDVMAGALIGRADLVAQVRRLHGVLGGVIDPHASYLLLRGLKTLPLRVEAHNRNARALAERLAADPRVYRVHWPALRQHPDHELGRRLAEQHGQFGRSGTEFGGVLSFELRGRLRQRDAPEQPYGRETFERVGRFIDALRLPYIGPSLGGTESLVEQVCVMGYFDQPLWKRKSLGITCGLIRFACGVEDAADIVVDVEQALDRAYAEGDGNGAWVEEPDAVERSVEGGGYRSGDDSRRGGTAPGF